MRLDLLGFQNVPHEVACWKHNAASRDPVVVNEELPILKSVNLHFPIKGLVSRHQRALKPSFERLHIKLAVPHKPLRLLRGLSLGCETPCAEKMFH
jgi:hypothetical protein